LPDEIEARFNMTNGEGKIIHLRAEKTIHNYVLENA
jgi:hypothetical protein